MYIELEAKQHIRLLELDKQYPVSTTLACRQNGASALCRHSDALLPSPCVYIFSMGCVHKGGETNLF